MPPVPGGVGSAFSGVRCGATNGRHEGPRLEAGVDRCTQRASVGWTVHVFTGTWAVAVPHSGQQTPFGVPWDLMHAVGCPRRGGGRGCVYLHMGSI
jgi:hypothetical protein